MQVVMELCHRITVLHYGADSRRRHAGGHPAAIRRCRRSISRHERRRRPAATPLVRVEDLHTYYGKSHILHGVSLDVAPGEVVGLLGRNGVGKSTTLEDDHGPGAAEPGPDPAQGRRHHRPRAAPARPPRHRLRAGGPPHLPPAHGDGEPAHRPRPRRRQRGAPQAAARQGVQLFPAAGRAAQPGRRHAVRRRAADAGDRARHDAGAEDHPARRADRGADAAHGVADQRDHRRAAQGGRRHPAGRAERAADARRRASASTSWRRAPCAITAPPPRSRSTIRSSSSIWGCERWSRWSSSSRASRSTCC